MLLSFALTCLSSLSCAGAVVSSSEELGNSSEATPSSIVANVLEGDITWEDENGAEHPLPGIKIEVGAERKISTTTDSSGHYSFYMVEVKAASMDFPPVFSVYLETNHAKIYDYYRVPYVKHWDLRGVSLDGSYEISHEFTSDGDGELGEATAPAEGDRNKGRICIDDIVLSFDEGETFPITGYSAIVERV